MLNYERNSIRTGSTVPLFYWVIAFLAHFFIFLLLKSEINFLVNSPPPIKDDPLIIEPIYENEVLPLKPQDTANIVIETKKEEGIAIKAPQQKPITQPSKKQAVSNKPVNPDMTYEQLLRSHIYNTANLLPNKPAREFNIKIHLTVDAEGNIVNHRLFPATSPDIKKYCETVFKLASPVPKPPIKDLKNNRSTYEFELHTLSLLKNN